MFASASVSLSACPLSSTSSTQAGVMCVSDDGLEGQSIGVQSNDALASHHSLSFHGMHVVAPHVAAELARRAAR
jgi:hypothetical protein